MECENTFHTFCRCPMVRTLWKAMTEIWLLPDIAEVSNPDNEWILWMLDGKTETVRVVILMTLWHIWHCRNEVVHQKLAPPVESSRSYLQSILTIKQFPTTDPVKGKSVVSWEVDSRTKRQTKI